MSAKKTWLITGASSGIGFGIAHAALQAGHTVIATARNPQTASSNHPEFEAQGGQWAQLDVSVPSAQETVERIIKTEEDRQSNANINIKLHWVIVNNAGVMLDGLVEDNSEAQVNDHLQVVLYGAIRVWRGSIPTLRRHRCGTLITMGSIFGMAPSPVTQLYSALKATSNSLTDSYATTLRPFGIRCMILEPGLFRTSLANNGIEADMPLTPDYAPRVKAWRGLVAACAANPKLMQGDPRKLGEAVVSVVDSTGLGKDLLASRTVTNVIKETEVDNQTEFPDDAQGALRVILGPDALFMWKAKYDALGANLAAMQELGGSTTYEDWNEG